MLKYLCKKKAQSSLEYAILIIIVLGALLTIQAYIKRGVQGRLKTATDDIGEQFSTANFNYDKLSHSWSQTNETQTQSGASSMLTEEDYSNVYVNGVVADVVNGGEYWGCTNIR